MSDKYNEAWLEAAKENYEVAVLNEDYALARAVIADLKENGFASQAVALEVELAQRQNQPDHE